MFLRSGGYSIITGPDGTIECDSFTCKHCNKVVMVAARASPESLGGRCTCCGGLVCPRCVDQPCEPLEEKLRMMEDPNYKRRHIYKMA